MHKLSCSMLLHVILAHQLDPKVSDPTGAIWPSSENARYKSYLGNLTPDDCYNDYKDLVAAFRVLIRAL